jgi:hypothetical protein
MTDELKKISYENFLRVFETVENNAKEIKKRENLQSLKRASEMQQPPTKCFCNGGFGVLITFVFFIYTVPWDRATGR